MEYLTNLLADPAAWSALAALVAMEVVLGIDNLVFIAILTNKLPPAERPRARRIGIGAALVLRLALLGLVTVIVGLTLFHEIPNGWTVAGAGVVVGSTNADGTEVVDGQVEGQQAFFPNAERAEDNAAEDG